VTTISEVGVNAMRVFDATDLSKPIPLGSWTFEYNPASWQHNLQIANGTLFFSHYENGVFAFDLHDVGTMPFGQTQQLVPIAHYAVASSSWDVIVKDGLLWIGDSNQVHTVGFGCNTPGDALATSTG